MATRPVFIPGLDGRQLVQEQLFEFPWSSGFAESQKKKNVAALHSAARRNGIGHLLEISTKSSEKVGQRLSAFSLKARVGDRLYPLESVYQGSKVFETGGPHVEIFSMSPKEAKRFIREENRGQLARFELEGKEYPLIPENAFYDWLYIRSLLDHAEWIKDNIQYEAFTDIEFNPAKQINCQARAFAEYLSLLRRGQLERAATDFDAFSDMLNPA